MKTKPKNAGKLWCGKDVCRLLCSFEAGKSLEELADEFGRTRGAIISMLCHLNRLVSHNGFYYKIDPKPWAPWRQKEKEDVHGKR